MYAFVNGDVIEPIETESSIIFISEVQMFNEDGNLILIREGDRAIITGYKFYETDEEDENYEREISDYLVDLNYRDKTVEIPIQFAGSVFNLA